MNGTRRALGALVLAGIACLAAQASEPPARRYAVISLVGDQILIVGSRAAIGSNLDRNSRQIVPTDNDEFDRAALAAADTALRTAYPGSTPALLSVRDRRLFDTQQKGLDAGAGLQELLALIGPILKDQGATHLLLVTKHRDEARMRFANTTAGHGKVEGLGFYLDRTYGSRRSDTGESALGFIAPFAYVKVSLIEASSMKVLQEEEARESRALSVARAKDGVDPWQVLSAAAKVRMLKQLLDEALARIVPKVAAAP